MNASNPEMTDPKPVIEAKVKPAPTPSKSENKTSKKAEKADP